MQKKKRKKKKKPEAKKAEEKKRKLRNKIKERHADKTVDGDTIKVIYKGKVAIPLFISRYS